jgi:hypothetical protein
MPTGLLDFYKLLRLSLGLPQEFPVDTAAPAPPAIFSAKTIIFRKNVVTFTFGEVTPVRK